jgi:hypothetical protein
MTKATQRIKSIIQSLLAKARGTDNEHEAEAFLSKAMDMMRQYQLDVSDMVDESDPILNHVGLKGAKSGHAWRWKLYRAVGVLYGCEGIYVEVGYAMDADGNFIRKNGKLTEMFEYRLVGRESAIITTDLMYPWIVSQVREHAKRLAPQTGMSEQGQAKRVAAALITRIWSLISAQKKTAPSTPSGKNALVVLEQVKAAFAEHYPSTELMKRGSSTTDSLSREAANSIGLHRQTGTEKQTLLG